MLWRKALLSLILVLTVECLVGAQKPYSTGKFVDLHQKTRDRVDMYLVNTPVTTAVPYFQISVELGDTKYLAEYTPRHSQEELPEAWKPGETVQGRVEKHYLYLVRPDGTEMKFVIDKKTAVKSEVNQEKSKE